MSENKRKHPGKESGPRKRYKADGSKISSTTIHGPGIFITCVKGKERQAGKEVREVFEEIARKLWPPETIPKDDSKPEIDDSGDEDEDEDLESRILKERSRLQAEQSGNVEKRNRSSKETKVKKRLVIHYTDTPCLLFVACAPPLDPVRLAVTYLDEVKASGIARTRAVQRLEPIADTCVAGLPELLSLGEKVLGNAFNRDTGDSTKFTYKVIAKVRNNGKLTSLKIIQDLPQKVPQGHIVSLTNPELIVFVVVFKSVAGIGVLPRYDELKRYNVTQLVDAKDLDTNQGQDSRLRNQALASDQQEETE